MGQGESRQDVVVTLCLGDAANAYAFKFLQKAGRIHLNPNWGCEVSCPYWLSPSCVLYHSDGTPSEEFGIKAELEYFRQLEKCEDKIKPTLYRQFKKQFQGKHASRREFEPLQQLCGVDGDTLKLAVDVFADALKSLKEKVMNQIVHCCEWEGSLSIGGSPDDVNNICWVVPMPDTWNKATKGFLKEACMKAGLIKKESHLTKDSKLKIPLESQCVSLLCRQLSWDKFVQLEQTDSPTFQTGVMYMIVNVGDEKMNISVHKVDSQHFEEVIEPFRVIHDGRYINTNLCNQLAKTFGREFVDHLEQSKPFLLWEMRRDFFLSLKRYQADTDLHTKIHLGFASAYKQFTQGGSLTQALRDNADSGLTISAASRFVWSGSAVKEIVGDIVYNIRETVYVAMDRVKESKEHVSRVNYVCFVGELVDWKFIQDGIREVDEFYSHKLTVLIPPEAALSVVKGAVLFGQQPYKLTSKKYWKSKKHSETE